MISVNSNNNSYNTFLKGLKPTYLHRDIMQLGKVSENSHTKTILVKLLDLKNYLALGKNTKAV